VPPLSVSLGSHQREPRGGWRSNQRMVGDGRHPGGGKRWGHDGFQIAPSGGRSLRVEAPLGKVKLAAPAVLGPVTQWR
jgi:hypothetical protein